MFSRVVVVVRCASRASFTLPPNKFRHSQLAAPNRDVPVISMPVSPKGKQDPGDERRHRGKSQQQFTKHTSCHRKSDLAFEKFERNKGDVKYFQELKRATRNKFALKSGSQSVEDRLTCMGININGEVIYGIFPILLALQAKRRTFHHLVYKIGQLDVNEKIQNILNIAEEQGIPITSLKPSQFKQVFQGDQVHQGVFCDVSRLQFVPLDENNPEHQGESEGDSHQAAEKHQLWLYLDQIQDPMNFGAVLRSAYFMGVNRILTSETCSSRITSTVSKASAGVAEIFPVYQVRDPVRLASSLTEAGWKLVSSATPNSGNNTGLTDVSSFQPAGNTLLIVGNEGKGISPELQRMCHTVLTITPGRSLHPHLQCLNVSVATALLLHSLQQRFATCKL